MKKFPKTLYVIRQGEDTNDPYLSAEGDLPSVDETTPVAVYQLVEVGEVAVSREYRKRGR